MKKILLVISALLLVAILIFFFKGKSFSVSSQKVKDIKLETRVDSLSYALGAVWAKDIVKHLEVRKMTYAFYLGAKDYFNSDSSKMGIYQTNMYLQKNVNFFKEEKNWPENDENQKLADISLKTKSDTFSYSLGFAWSAGASGVGITEVSPSLITGLMKGFKGDTSVFKNYAEANAYLMNYVEGLRLQKFAYYKKTNEDWLTANAKNEGIKQLPNGIQYKVVKSGKGISPGDLDIVECNYIGKLIDGRVFDNAYQSGPTFKFYMGSVITGWTQALKNMKEGDEWIVYIPQELAYGSNGMGDLVPPYSTVMLDVELIKVSPVKH